jgi:hypothetical protein
MSQNLTENGSEESTTPLRSSRELRRQKTPPCERQYKQVRNIVCKVFGCYFCLDLKISFFYYLFLDGTKEIIEIDADGNCLFRALADNLYYDHGAAHVDIRNDICDYLLAHEEEFKAFLVLDDDNAENDDAADFESYVNGMREDGTWGGNLELVVAARLYQRNILVYSADLDTYTISQEGKKPKGPDMMVSYHDNDHYNSVRDRRVSKPPTFTKVSYEALEANRSDNGSTSPDDNTSDENASSNDTGSEEYDENVDQREDCEATEQSPLPANRPKKTAPCPCGSGLQYKKCCLVKERTELRAQKKMQRGHIEPSSEEEVELDGPFRVMVI